MNQWASSCKRYVLLYKQFIAMTLKQMLEYRLNFVIRSIHPVFYAGMFLAVILTIFTKISALVGWSLDEVLLMFGVLHLMFGVQMFTFMMGVEQLMTNRVRKGDFDFELTKPVNAQFLTTLQYPWLDAVIFTTLATALVIRQLIILHAFIHLLNIFLFLIVFVASLLIWYFVISIFATVSFYVSQAQQIMFFLEKISDYAPYPTPIFPKSIQLMSWTIFPIAFYAYIPTSILLGKSTPLMWVGLATMLPLTFLISKYAWKVGLKHYSSASS